MRLEIITPDKVLFNGEVDAATFPGSKGSFQVLKNHAALISSLDAGKVIIKNEKEVRDIMINGGIVEVLNNKIIVLAEEVPQE
jgi:F-type H+-transporting ATPase subunit epsilon